MKQYKLLNNVVGWVVFAFALFVYGSTIESSASFWDCGEFVPAALKLQVAHPPGAPMFIMIGRVFTLFAGSDMTKVPVMINFMSGLSSAFAILFLFWTTTMLAKKVLIKSEEDYSMFNMVAIFGAGIIAATCGTFTDSFWFSAVEGEVYALSSFFLMLVIWAIFKWDASDEKYADRWMIFVGYAVGLSLGVHLLSLLALPILGIAYYFKKYKFNWMHFAIAFVISFASVPLVMKFVISGIPTAAAFFDKLFVNTLSAPFYTGVYFFFALTIATFVALFIYTKNNNHARTNTLILAIAFCFIGYSSYIMVPIRSIANTPINMNKPQDPYRLLSYLNREQYGDRPLVFGPQYSADNYDIERVDDDGAVIYKNKTTGKYEEVDKKFKYVWKDGVEVLFPRMGVLMDNEKTQAYRGWFDKWGGATYNVVDRAQNNEIIETYSSIEEAQQAADAQNKGGQPRFAVKDNIGAGDNIAFFVKYQIGYMYFRYLMWNFSGRQSDEQGLYYNDDGRWITGINALDNLLKPLGTPQSDQSQILPDKKGNWARNVFYGIPFILGLIGAFYLFRKNPTVFTFVLLFWLLTGVVQIIGLNQPPREPRERDYIFAGSVLAFSIWIGFAVIFIAEEISKRMKGSTVPAYIAIALCAVAPFLMGSQGWDDHDRSKRYVARDMAIDYLESCAPNAILFTQGDNDTYPLWYAQEVENIRPDIRIINLSLLGVDWYIDQLHFKLNDGPAIKTSFNWDQIKASNRNVVRYKASPALDANTYYPLKDIMAFVASEKPGDKTINQNGEAEAYFPTLKVYMPVDTNKIAKLDILAKEDLPNMLKTNLNWDIPSPTIMKDKLMILDIIANNLWERPIYFAISCSPDMYVGLDKYVQLEGMANRIVPYLNPDPRASIYESRLRTDVMYDRMLNKFKWGNMKDPDVYLDENIMRMTYNIRSNFGRLASELANRGEKDKALNILNKAMTELPTSRVPLNIYNMSIPEAYYKAGDKTNGRKYAEELVNLAKVYLDLYDKQGESLQNQEVQRNLYILNNMMTYMRAGGDEEAAKKVDVLLAKYNQRFPQPQQQMMPQQQ
jgi:hypothetical protein